MASTLVLNTPHLVKEFGKGMVTGAAAGLITSALDPNQTMGEAGDLAFMAAQNTLHRHWQPPSTFTVTRQPPCGIHSLSSQPVHYGPPFPSGYTDTGSRQAHLQ